MPVLREKKIKVQYRPPDVSDDEYKQVYNMWIRDVPIHEMSRRLAPIRIARKQEPLIYLDLYTVLFVLLRDKKIQQRTSNRGELTVLEFCEFFRLWKCGSTEKECLAPFRDDTNKVAHGKKVLRSTAERYRREQKAVFSSSNPDDPSKIRREVLSLAIRQKVNNRPALVIYIEDIPVGLVNQLRDLPGFTAQLDTELMNAEDILKGIQDARPPAELQNRTAHPTTVPDGHALELRTLDPTGELDELGQEVDQSDKAELESQRRLRPRDSEKAVDGFQLPEVLAAAPSDEESEELLSKDAMDLSLENLLDDDSPDGDSD